MKKLLFVISPNDPTTLGAVALTLALTGRRGVVTGPTSDARRSDYRAAGGVT